MALLAPSSPPTTMGPMPGMPGMGSSAVTHPAITLPAATGGAGHAGATHAMTGMGVEPPVNAHTLLTHWQVSPFPVAVAVVLVILAAWYVMATRRLALRGRRWPVSRTVSFLLSLLAVELAIGSSVAVFTNYSFTAHVIQHLLLMVVAPPLAALSAPMTLALQTSPRSVKRRLLRTLKSPVFAVVSHPVLVFFLYYLSMYAFFLTGALGYAMDHMWLMDLLNLGFLGGATLFWWPMVGIDPLAHWRFSPGLKMLNLLVGVPVESFLGIALLLMSSPVAPMYTLTSTHTGGGVLWVFTELSTVAAIAPLFVQWTRADARNARHIDARIAAGEGMAPPVFEGHGLSATFKALRRG